MNAPRKALTQKPFPNTVTPITPRANIRVSRVSKVLLPARRQETNNRYNDYVRHNYHRHILKTTSLRILHMTSGEGRRD
jgi:hypothetical protein